MYTQLVPGKLYVMPYKYLEANHVRLHGYHYESATRLVQWYKESGPNQIIEAGVPWMYIEDCSADVKKFINGALYVKIIYKDMILYAHLPKDAVGIAALSLRATCSAL